MYTRINLCFFFYLFGLFLVCAVAEATNTNTNVTPLVAHLEKTFRELHENKTREKQLSASSMPLLTTRNELKRNHKGDKAVIVIYARGTSEPGNIGNGVGPAFIAALEAVGNGTVLVQGVDYPATVWDYLTGGSNSGAKDMAMSVELAVKKYPLSKIVLAGFSQGAQVTHKAGNLIPKKLYKHIMAIVLFGDPNRGHPFPGCLNDRVRDFCHETDLICHGWPIPLPSHLTYEDDVGEAAAFVMSTMGR